jgi:sarcosine oxidase subunit alpha
MTRFRLAQGVRIDRSRGIRFQFDGRDYTGHPGDTLASALLANGVHLTARSFKYHRPRGILSSGAEEPNALVSIGTGARHTPNLRATQADIHDGLVATSQNRYPSLAFDLGAASSLFSPLLAAGFYYKTFIGPGRAWQRLYEPLIRRAAGLGTAPTEPDPDTYTQRFAFCDVLVIGAGAAGIAAALAASEGGARVMLVDEQAECGGGLLSETDATIDGVPASAWAAQALATLAARPNVQILTRTTAFGYFAQNFVGLAERLTDHLGSPPAGRARERLWKLRARRVVLAAGAIERPLVFGNNDRPGVMLAGAARSYANRYGVLPGRRAVVFAADDSGYAAARDLARAGVEIAAVADLRAEPGCDVQGLRVRTGTAIVDTGGRLRVRSADLQPLTGGSVERIACDLVLMAGGWTPSLHLFSQSRGRLVFDEERQIFLPGEPVQDMECAGACRGVVGIGDCIGDGFAAGARAAGVASRSPPSVDGEIVPAGGFHGLVPGAVASKSFVDFQNDVKASDIAQAVREGFRSIEHVKRYTTTGMATDQGKTSNMNALAIASGTLARPLPDVGLTTFRMPYTPVTFGTFSGHARDALFDPIRRTPMHAIAEGAGAVFEDVGQWKRANHFRRRGETAAQAVARECRAVRAAAGLFDASTLGKIEVVGPDAAAFLDRMYVNPLSRLAPGRCRYGLMLNEAGFVVDDGVIGRIAPDRFHVTTTTSGAAHVLAQMEDFLQTEFTGMRCWLTSTTEQWAVIAVQGPRARDVIAPLVEGVDLSPEAFPHMSVTEARVCGIAARLFRVSFTGELGFEINVPAGHGGQVWSAVWQSGRGLGLTPYGTEAMHVLRAEKGYIVVGQETDGTVTPDDLGLSWAIGRSKDDFIGKRGLARPDLMAAGRLQLVGLLTDEPATVLDEGAQITRERAPAIGTRADGHVTSSYRSETLSRSIALAMLADGRARVGETVFIPMPVGAIAAKVVGPVFHDPDGKRLHG